MLRIRPPLSEFLPVSGVGFFRVGEDVIRITLMQYAGGMLLPPVQKLVATLRAAQ